MSVKFTNKKDQQCPLTIFFTQNYGLYVGLESLNDKIRYIIIDCNNNSIKYTSDFEYTNDQLCILDGLRKIIELLNLNYSKDTS